MAITDIQISEELETNAPSIKYRGNEGPKSPQEMEMMMASVDDPFYRSGDEDEHSFRMFGKPYKELNADELEEFREEMMRLMNKFSGGQPLPEDPTKPVNPFAPKPTGPVLPDRQMAAYGGIMGVDGRKQYGIGSFFQKKIMDPIKKNPAVAATLAALGSNYFDVIPGEKSSKGYLDFLIDPVTNVITKKRGEGDDTYTYGGKILEGLSKNIVPALGGIAAGLFTKNQPEQPGLPSDTTALQLADLKKAANLATQQQGMAAGLNFLPAVSARKFTPEEMAITYAKESDAKLLAQGGRIGFNQGNMAVDEQTTQMILDMNKRGMDVDTISTITQQNADTVNAILSSQNKKAEGGIMDLGGLEKDYRAEGGFVPIGKEEKADDVPARLSVNEFVFTADAVRNAGGGDIDQGAQVMENMMKHLEAGGQVSRESQGMGGAREMFEVSERLSEVV